MKKTKIILKKIVPSLCIFSILLSLFAFSAFADGGQIGNGDFAVSDDIQGYDRPRADHGLPISVTYYGFANDGCYSLDFDIYNATNYTLDNFGVTYPPSNPNSSVYLTDQYSRNEVITTSYKPNAMGYSSGTIVSWYHSLAVDVGKWFDENVTYSMYSLLMPKQVVSSGYSYGWEDYTEILDDAVEYSNSNLIDDETYCANLAEFSYSGQIMTSLVSTDMSYGPESFVNYVLVPLQAEGVRPYYNIRLEGYTLTSSGKQELSVEVNEGYDNMFFYNEYNYGNTFPRYNLNAMAYFYDNAYGLPVWYCTMPFSVITDIATNSGITVITDFSVYYGLEYYSSNSTILDYRDYFDNYPIVGSLINYNEVRPYTQVLHDDAVYNYIRGSGNDISAFSLNWLGSAISGVFDADIFGTFGIGDIMFVVIGIGIFVAVLKIFAGG